MADMGPLFDWTPPPPSAPKGQAERQDAELERVSTRIRRAILDFAQAHLGNGPADLLDVGAELIGEELLAGSADRILRALRQDGELAYRVINRSKSLYLIEGV